MPNRDDLAVDLDHLRLLASAFAGRTVEVDAVEPGDACWTDGSTVFVDPDAPHSQQVEMLAVQGSLLAAGSLAPDLLRQIARRPALARRYLAVEGHRALAANEHLLPQSACRLIDHDIAAALATAGAALEVARSRRTLDETPALFGTIRVRAILASVDRLPAAPHAATPGAAAPPIRSAELADLTDDDGYEDLLGDLMSSPVGGGGPIGRLLRRMLQPVRRRGGGGPPGADAPTHRTDSRPGAGHRTVLLSNSPDRLDAGPDVDPSGIVYPEWDLRRRSYRPDWCTVVESTPSFEGGLVAPLARDPAVRRSLARLGIGLTPCRRQRQGDDIDIDGAVEARVDTIAGTAHHDNVYIESLRRRRDLAVLILLDVSGSAAEAGVAGKPVHEHQRAAAAALVTALHDLGERVALYAFNSRGRRAVQLLRVKAFDDHLDGVVARRLASLEPAAYTRLGAAIRHGTTILDERGGTPRRLLVVLSDGFAYDHGYEGRYGEADARRSLVEARRRGVGCVCLSAGADADAAALARVFGAAAHATVPRAEQVPAVIAPLFRAALRSAEAQRRAFQRKDRTRERLQMERRTDDRSGTTLLRAHR
ncbi:MAG: VWA domain-containing protein [Acidimicrobiales bacterium]